MMVATRGGSFCTTICVCVCVCVCVYVCVWMWTWVSSRGGETNPFFVRSTVFFFVVSSFLLSLFSSVLFEAEAEADYHLCHRATILVQHCPIFVLPYSTVCDTASSVCANVNHSSVIDDDDNPTQSPSYIRTAVRTGLRTGVRYCTIP